ncbi:MAG: hypothetical protein C0501_10360 [Isosphaera sp.]|nr:hypothetical protein [Isosphaera sp.]
MLHDEPFAFGQPDWRWCRKCQGLAYAGDASDTPVPGPCPAGGLHDHTGSFDYILAHDQAPGSGEANWRWCRKCQGLAFAGNGGPGACPAGDQHDHSTSFDYILFPGPISAFRLEITNNGRPGQATDGGAVEVTNRSGQAAVLVAGTLAVYVAPESPMWVEPIVPSLPASVTVWKDRRDGTSTQVDQIDLTIGDATEGGYELMTDGRVDIPGGRERGRRTR